MANTIFLHTRTQVRVPSGAGEKVVRGTCNITPATDTLEAEEVNLKTIRKIFAHTRNMAQGGTNVRAWAVAPGTFDNRASFFVERIRAVAGTSVFASGGINAGTHLIDFVVFGD